MYKVFRIFKYFFYLSKFLFAFIFSEVIEKILKWFLSHIIIISPCRISIYFTYIGLLFIFNQRRLQIIKTIIISWNQLCSFTYYAKKSYEMRTMFKNIFILIFLSWKNCVIFTPYISVLFFDAFQAISTHILTLIIHNRHFFKKIILRS